MPLKVVPHDSTDERRARQIRTERKARRHALDEAIDQFHTAVIDAGTKTTAKPVYAASCRVGRARKHLIAVIERNDRAERLAA